MHTLRVPAHLAANALGYTLAPQKTCEVRFDTIDHQVVICRIRYTDDCLTASRRVCQKFLGITALSKQI